MAEIGDGMSPEPQPFVCLDTEPFFSLSEGTAAPDDVQLTHAQ
jgi:hypothetical protein